MGSHPINLAARFLLELGALLGFARWGWTLGDGFVRVASLSSGEYRRIVGLNFTSVFIALILIQRSRASSDPRAVQFSSGC